jgi:hypothetical protein
VSGPRLPYVKIFEMLNQLGRNQMAETIKGHCAETILLYVREAVVAPPRIIDENVPGNAEIR